MEAKSLENISKEIFLLDSLGITDYNVENKTKNDFKNLVYKKK